MIRRTALLLAILVAPVALAEHYTLKDGESLVIMRVYKGGSFKALAHNHIISTRSVTGTVEFDPNTPANSRVSLTLPIDAFEVDNTDLRKQAGEGFTFEVDDDARKGTRKNMLGKKVLDAVHFPAVSAQSRSIKKTGDAEYEVTLELGIHGQQQTVVVPVTLQQSPGRIKVSGEFPLKQTDYGMTPLKAGFGTITVLDKLDIRFELIASQ